MSQRPPHSLEAEQAVLGAVLIRPSAVDEISDLAIDDMFLPAHRAVLEAMRRIAGAGKALDVITLHDELQATGALSRLEGGVTYLDVLSSAVPTAENIRHYTRIVRQKATLRRLIQACAEIQAQAYGDLGPDGAAELVAEARQKLAGIDLADDAGPTRLRDEIGPTMDSIEHRAQQPDTHFLQTGLRAFDEKIGGLREANLIVIAARPGNGKSALALDVLLHAASRGIPCLLFSFEMSKMEIVERSLTKRARVNGRNVVRGRLSYDEWHKVQGAAGKLADAPLWLDTRPLTAPRICAEARRWLAIQRRGGAHGLACVAVDYLGLVKSTGDEESREREVAEMSRSLKLLATELSIPVIAISQLNRESEKSDRKPRLSDLRESGAVEQDANMVLFPWWEGTPPLEGEHPAMIIVRKNRGGPVGEIDCLWEPEFMTFTDCSFYDGSQVDHGGRYQ